MGNGVGFFLLRCCFPTDNIYIDNEAEWEVTNAHGQLHGYQSRGLNEFCHSGGFGHCKMGNSAVASFGTNSQPG